MAVTPVFQQAVQNGDVLSVRIMMKDSLLRDPSFSEFDEMTNKAKNMAGLYDSHDGTVFNTDKSKWNDDYMSEIRIDLLDNFSHERIEHLKEVTQYLHPYTQEERRNLSKLSKKSNNSEIARSALLGAAVGGGAVLAAATVATAATTAAAPVVAGAIIGSGVGAIANMLKNNHQNGGK